MSKLKQSFLVFLGIEHLVGYWLERNEALGYHFRDSSNFRFCQKSGKPRQILNQRCMVWNKSLTSAQTLVRIYLKTYMSRIRSRRAKRLPNSIFWTNRPLTSGIVLIRLPISVDDFLKTNWRFSMPVLADRIKIFFVLILVFNLLVTR